MKRKRTIKPVGVNDFTHLRINKIVERIDMLPHKAANLARVILLQSAKQGGAQRTLRKAGSSRHFSSTELGWGL